MASNYPIPTPRAVVRTLNGMLAKAPVIAALAPYAASADAFTAANGNDRAALAGLVDVYSPGASVVAGVRVILNELVNTALAPAPIDGTPEAAEAAQQSFFTSAARAPEFYCAAASAGRSSPLKGRYTSATGTPWWEIVGADGRLVII
jgi:hypothetical protein